MAACSSTKIADSCAASYCKAAVCRKTSGCSRPLFRSNTEWCASPAKTTCSPCARFSRSARSEEHTSELQSPCNLVCRLLLEKNNHSWTLSLRADLRASRKLLAPSLPAPTLVRSEVAELRGACQKRFQAYLDQLVLFFSARGPPAYTPSPPPRSPD